jgi:hypothetical protein
VREENAGQSTLTAAIHLFELYRGRERRALASAVGAGLRLCGSGAAEEVVLGFHPLWESAVIITALWLEQGLQNAMSSLQVIEATSFENMA